MTPGATASATDEVGTEREEIPVGEHAVATRASVDAIHGGIERGAEAFEQMLERERGSGEERTGLSERVHREDRLMGLQLTLQAIDALAEPVNFGREIEIRTHAHPAPPPCRPCERS